MHFKEPRGVKFGCLASQTVLWTLLFFNLLTANVMHYFLGCCIFDFKDKSFMYDQISESTCILTQIEDLNL